MYAIRSYYVYVLGVSELKLRKKFIETLEINPGDRVLATSVGTGSDLPFLPHDCNYYGLDLSSGMLKVCRKKMRKLDASAELFLGQAEHLPFKNDSFDVVYHRITSYNVCYTKLLRASSEIPCSAAVIAAALDVR